MSPLFRLCLLPPLLFASPARAQTDGQLWANVLAQGSISGDLLFWVDTSARFGDDATQLGQTLFRGAIGARVSKDLSLHAGYVHVRTTPRNGALTVEHRGWQQALYPIIRGDRAQLIGRTRLEQRWLEGRDGMSLRARQLFRLNVPLGDPSAPRFIAWHEAFLTLTDTSWSPDTGFDQHRSFVGLALPMGPHALEVGAFAQRFPQPEPDRVNRALNITLVANF
jgi:hypothetical protein